MASSIGKWQLQSGDKKSPIVNEKPFETSDILSDVYTIYGGHPSKLWQKFCMLLYLFSVFLSDILSNVLGENVVHVAQNVRHI